MIRTGTYYGSVFARRISGFRGVNQSVAPLYPDDSQRVPKQMNFVNFDFTLKQREGAVPKEKVSGRVNGACKQGTAVVVAHGDKIGITVK